MKQDAPKRIDPHRPLKPKRDDSVDVLRAAAREAGASNADIYHETYLSRGTISRLLETRAGKKRTRYPQMVTLKGIAAALGKEYRLVDKEDT